jgi:hypothetical protein
MIFKWNKSVQNSIVPNFGKFMKNHLAANLKGTLLRRKYPFPGTTIMKPSLGLGSTKFLR